MLIDNVGMICKDRCKKKGPCEFCGQIGLCCNKNVWRECDEEKNPENLDDNYICIHPHDLTNFKGIKGNKITNLILI